MEYIIKAKKIINAKLPHLFVEEVPYIRWLDGSPVKSRNFGRNAGNQRNKRTLCIPHSSRSFLPRINLFFCHFVIDIYNKSILKLSIYIISYFSIVCKM